MEFPSLIDMQSLTNVPIGTDAAIRALTLKAIYTAAVSGLTTTAAISTTGPTAEQLRRLFADIHANGLNVANSGSTFTVRWG